MKKLIPFTLMLLMSCSKSTTNPSVNPNSSTVLTATLNRSTNLFTLSINKSITNSQITGNVTWTDNTGFPVKLLVTAYIGGITGTPYQTTLNLTSADVSPMTLTPISVTSGSEVSDIKIQVN